MREVMLRDLGGLVYEINRTGADAAQADKLVGEKVARLHLLDAESEELEQRLGDPTGELLLREPGIGGACPSCGELHGSDAAFCSQCGARVDREGEKGS